MEDGKLSPAEVEAIERLLDLVEGPAGVDSGQAVVCKISEGVWAFQDQGCNVKEIQDQLKRKEEPKPACPRCHKPLRRAGDVFFMCSCGN